jgi:CheY-like chemotaxis protein
VLLAEEVIDLLAEQAKKKGLGLDLNCTTSTRRMTVLVDPERLRQLLLNLVGNAIKFTDTGSVKVEMACSALHKPDQPNRLVCRVTDTGMGIPQELQNMLFQRFSQIDSSPKLILVAEDDEAIRQLVTIRLELAGFRVVSARTGFQALEQLRVVRPDGMVLDIGLPQLDGFGVLSTVRKQSRNLPILMLTARNSTTDVQRALLLGAHDYLTKPFDDQVLITRVRRMFQPRKEEVWAI